MTDAARPAPPAHAARQLAAVGPYLAVGAAAYGASLVPAMFAPFVRDATGFLLMLGGVGLAGLGVAWLGVAWLGLTLGGQGRRGLPVAALAATVLALGVAAAALAGGLHASLPFHAVYQAGAWLGLFALSWLAWL